MRALTVICSAASARARRLAADTRAVAMVEFAFALPILLTIGMYGSEIANLAVMNLKVSQIALAAADNASRVGASSNLAYKQLRESDVDDILNAIRQQGNPINFSQNGRITLSSLENVKQSFDATQVQRIHWQRCIGLKSGAGYDSSYGTAPATAGVSDGTSSAPATAGNPAPLGMGPATATVIAPPDAAVMFVEVNYDYQPIVAQWLLGARRLSYTASFVVRDKRDFKQIYSSTSSAQTCDKHNV